MAQRVSRNKERLIKAAVVGACLIVASFIVYSYIKTASKPIIESRKTGALEHSKQLPNEGDSPSQANIAGHTPNLDYVSLPAESADATTHPIPQSSASTTQHSQAEPSAADRYRYSGKVTTDDRDIH